MTAQNHCDSDTTRLPVSEVDPFAHLDDDLDGPKSQTPPRGGSVLNGGDAPYHHETCGKCRGTGRFGRFGTCYACKGRGRNSYKTDARTRAKARESSAARKASARETAIEQFKAEHPKVWLWMDGSTFAFAVTMREKLAQWGSLTENQLAACYRCVEKLDAARAERAAARPAEAPLSLDKIQAAFDAVVAQGAKRVTLRYEGMTLSLAKEGSANPGAIYVKADGRYIGKILGAQFRGARECMDADKAKLALIAADPKGMAVKYGKDIGECSCCGATLTDPVSKAAGIGPICASKWGW